MMSGRVTSEVSLGAEAARTVGLRYVNDGEAGITRLGPVGRFRYVTSDKKPVRDAATLRRIKALVIPPAWTNVWICSTDRGHIQATGRDAKGRKQYRYHAKWRTERDANKFERMFDFGAAMPKITAAVSRDLSLPGLPREKVLATIVRLLELTCIRVGNEEYARTNKSFGLTTLRNRHVDVEGTSIRFSFRGKSGVSHTIGIRDRRIARIVQKCEELPGQQLFGYADESGNVHAIESSDVNAYIQSITGADFTAKDFRTLAGTLLAARLLEETGTKGDVDLRKAVNDAVKSVARRLGNTVSVCRKCYIHPAVIDAFMRGSLGAGPARRSANDASIAQLIRAPIFQGLSLEVA